MTLLSYHIDNPKIISEDGVEEMEEGCLSFPGIYANVKRAHHLKVEAQDKNGETFTVEAEDLFAVCIQHELDHLNGKLFVDHISSLKRDKIRTKLKKHQRLNA